MNLKDKIKEQFEGEKEALKKKRKSIEKQEKDLLKKAEIIDKFKENKPETKEDYEELMGVLCFNSLAYCCKPKMNNCIWRNQVLSILGISIDEFVKKKDKFGKELIGGAK